MRLKRRRYSVRQTAIGIGTASWIIGMIGATEFLGTSFLTGFAVLITTVFHGSVLFWIYRRTGIPNKFLE